MRAFPRFGRTMAVAVLAASAALGACTDSEEEKPEEPRDDHSVLEELSERSQQSMDQSYSASYLIGDEDPSLFVVQDAENDRTAISLNDQTHILTPEYSAVCEGDDCTYREEPDVSASEWMQDLTPQLLPAQWDVDYWLTELETDSAAEVDYHDTRLAGELADCVEVEGAVDSPVSAYELCMTTNGVLASLSAVVDGEEIEVKLTNFSDSVDEQFFELAEATSAPDSDTSNT